MMTSRTTGRHVAIRLCDVPVKTRRFYGRLLTDKAALDGDLLLAAQIQRAVEHPSRRVYWLPEKAVRKVLR